MSIYKHATTGQEREIDDALHAAWVAAGNPKAAVWLPYTPPPPEPEELDYPITKDTIVYRMKMAGKLGVLMGFTKSLPALLQYEFEQSAWFERSTWAQYVVHFGLTEEETKALLAPDETTDT